MISFRQYIREGRGDPPIIYVDMDGVLANFDKGVRASIGVSADDMSRDQKNILLSTPGFFRNLEPLPDAQAAWQTLNRTYPHVRILSAVSDKNDECGAEKIGWIQQHLNPTPKPRDVQCVLQSDKKRFASSNTVLIDDNIKNIREFEAADGVGVLHTPGDFANSLIQVAQAVKQMA